ncbi:MAG: L-aspartate oxidase [Holophagae bacterium]|jgi:L-aspartate oxidase
MSRSFDPDELRTAEVVIVGGGVAGLTTALHARGREVVLLSKVGYGEGGSSVYAQGGVAAAIAPDDSPEQHAQDTLAAGAGLCDQEVVARVTAEGPQRIGELLVLGAALDRQPDGSLSLGREGAHSRHRVAHASGDATGAEMVRALAAGVRSASNVTIVEHHFAIDLVMDRGAVVGVLTVDRSGRQVLYVCSEVVLATGGIGRLWSRTTNPDEVTGDGLAMALRCGAKVADLEFMQFHPTALDVGASPMPLLTEALRGDGAVLTDETGQRFMANEHPLAELAPRDIVARGIWRQLREGHRVFLDARSLGDRVERRFPTVAGLCREHGFNLATEPVPVTPAAHYHMGGIMVDADGRSSVPGLWAVGEVTRTGLHGANRLASNSLLEGLVFGAAAGEALAAGARAPVHPMRVREAAAQLGVQVSDQPWLDEVGEKSRAVEAELQRLMWDGVGLVRDAAGLRRATFEFEELMRSTDPGRGELHNLLIVADMVIRAATLRTESRGAHNRSDTPSSSPCWRQPLVAVGSTFLDPRPVMPAIASG